MSNYENAIEIKSLTKKYDGFTLDDISFDVPKGSVMGFIGQNGAGKTTTIKAIFNIISRDAGTINVLGLDNIENEYEIKEDVAAVFDELPFLGIFMMCIMCVCMSPFLTLLTKRTGSVFPAALAHGANNQLTGVIISFLATEKFLERFSSEYNIIVIEILPIAIVGVISYIILITDYMKKKKEA